MKGLVISMIKLIILFADGSERESPILFETENEAMGEYYAWEDGEGVGQDFFDEVTGFDFEYTDDDDDEE